MRLKHPLNGFKLARGHILYHLAFYLGSLIAVTLDSGESTNLKFDLTSYQEDP